MKNVLLVFGGKSYEHDISVVTAFQIYKKSRLVDVNLVLLYVSRDERFFVCNMKKLDIEDFSVKKFSGRNSLLKEVFFVSGEKGKMFAKTHFGLKEYISANTAIFACHGGDGENGKLVTFFEKNGINCSAGSSDALAVCMDKFLFKSFAKGNNIPVVAGFKVTKHDYDFTRDLVIKKAKRYGFPLIIKTNSGGSSIGVFVANTIEEFEQQIVQAFEFDDVVLIEKFVTGARELNVAVLGESSKFEISEIDEPIKTNQVLTFADKYLSGDGKSQKGNKNLMAASARKFPADLPKNIEQKIKLVAKKIFVLLELRGVVRIDFLYDEKNNKIFVCEVNAIPGSLAFYFFKKNRIIVNDLMEKLIDTAENQEIKTVNQSLYVDILTKK